MSHYHLEIIMPPTDDIEKAVKEIMEPFNECGKDEDGEPTKYGFWDWYVIGGRWAGEKTKAALDEARLAIFYDKLEELKVTVSGLQAGKQELQPASQIPIVDVLWRETFPEGGSVCPLFNHYNDPYKNSEHYPDVMKLKDIPKELTAARVIVAGIDYNGIKLEARSMKEDSYYNGVSWNDTKWDGLVSTVLAEHIEGYSRATDDYRAKYIPADDWLVVTVDYHN